MQTSCPQCSKVHTLGARIGGPCGLRRLCSKDCEEEYMKSGQQHAAVKSQTTPEQVEVLARLGVRKARYIKVYCNRCVTEFQWCPALNGSECPECGYRLDRHGPFEQPSHLLKIALMTW
jgi:hypothetical protein